MITTSESCGARLGKIARLPSEIRTQLNERLADNEPAESVLAWLNAERGVQAVLRKLFAGRPISQQNLSAWKLGGFRDWERYQEARGRTWSYLEEAEELGEEMDEKEDGRSLLDRVGDRMALALLELFREAELSEKGAPRTRAMLEIARELARLRRGDHERQRSAVQQERWQREHREADRQMSEEKLRKQAETKQGLTIRAAVYSRDLIRGLATGTISEGYAQVIQDFFARSADQLDEFGVEGLPPAEELARRVEEVREQLARQKSARRKKARVEEEVAEDGEA